MSSYQPIGEMLVDKGKLSREKLEQVLVGHRGSRGRIGEELVKLGLVSEMDVADCLAEQFSFSVVDPRGLSPEPEALALLTSEVALSHRILPIRNTDCAIECAIADPLDFPTTDMIAQIAKKRVVLYISPASGLVSCIRRSYGLPSKAKPVSARPQVSKSRVPEPQVDRQAILADLDIASCGSLIVAEK